MRLSRLLLLALLTCVTFPASSQDCPADAVYCATFDADAEGWTSDSAPATHRQSGGNPGGYIALEADGFGVGSADYVPSAPFPQASGLSLSFDAYGLGSESGAGYPSISLAGEDTDGSLLYLQLDPAWLEAEGLPATSANWARYPVPLTNVGTGPAPWVVREDGDLRSATEYEIEQTLATIHLGGIAALVAFRTDRSPWPVTEGGLDNVVIRDGSAPDGPAVALVASREQAVTGQTFQVAVVAGQDEPVADLFGASFEVGYDVLQTMFVEFVPDRDFGKCDLDLNTDDLITSVTPQAESIAIAVTRRADRCMQGVSGEVRLGHLVFEVPLAVPGGPAEFSLSDLESLNAKGDQLALAATGTSVNIIDGMIVWPGDTDASGAVDVADVLPIGARFGEAGPVRSERGYQWAGFAAPFWDELSDTSVDANGDGEIDEGDVLAIGVNYGREVADGSSSRRSAQPLATLEVGPRAVGTEIRVDVVLEAEDLLGVAAALDVPAALEVISATSTDWLDDGDLLSFETLTDSGLEVAATRKRGAGTIQGRGAVLEVVLRVSSEMTGPATVALRRLTVGTPTGQAPASPGAVHLSSSFATSGGEAAALETVLEAVYPNPAATSATVRFVLADAGPVRLAVYDLLGREVAVLEDGAFQAGAHQTSVPVASMPAGTYLIRLTAGTTASVGRLSVAR